MSFDENSRIVVTGPTGAVGTALLQELTTARAEITAVCRKGSRRIANLMGMDSLRIIECDLQDYGSLPSLLEGRYDAFYHLAWAGTSGPARQDWQLQGTNAIAALQAAQIAHDLGCEVFVGVGSQAEYGRVSGVMDPNGSCNPETGYGAAKLAARDLTKAYCSHVGVRHEWCRILSLYGPGDRPQSLIMDVIYTLLAHEQPSCTPCDQIWDYVYSKDAACAMRLVGEKGRHGETYLIASGVSRPLKEFVCSIRDVVSPGALIGFGERPYYPNQAMRLEADIANLVADTGFKVRYSFEEGIKETLEWILGNSESGERTGKDA